VKNSEILKTGNDKFLSSIDRQRRYVLRQLTSPRRCPNCAQDAGYFEAIGIAIDDLDLHKETADRPARCPHCHRGLEYKLPMMGDWYWHLIPED